MSWEKVKFSDLYTIPSKNGLTKPSKVRGSGFKMINMGELFANDRIYDIQMELVPLTEKEKNSKVEVDDLLFARQSLVLSGAGKCCIVMEVSPLTVFESHIIRVRLDKKKAYPLFYYYYFNSPASPIKSIVSQGVQAGIRASDLSDLEVILPSRAEQVQLANILSAYDDLIENNQQQIKLLEEAAQRLYKEWFVDLHFPGYENTKIVDAVPEGWGKSTIKDVCKKIGAGGTPKRSEKSFWEPHDIKWYKTGELLDAWLLDSSEYISNNGLENSAAKVFPKNTILMAIYASPTLGHLGVLSSEASCNQAALGLVADETKVSWQWLYQKLLELRDEFNAVARGAGQQNISADVVKEKQIVVPTKEIMDQYTVIAKNFFGKILTLQNTIWKCNEARNRLLPKLMSGELEV